MEKQEELLKTEELLIISRAKKALSEFSAGQNVSKEESNAFLIGWLVSYAAKKATDLSTSLEMNAKLSKQLFK